MSQPKATTPNPATAIDQRPLMKCGCVAISIQDYGTPRTRPACPIHGCDEIAPTRPSLEGRTARCDQNSGRPLQRPRRDYGPIYGGGDKIGLCDNRVGGGCRCTVASSYSLPFFTYRGPGSPYGATMCKCGNFYVMHLPVWRATILVDREWYKVGRKVYDEIRSVRATDDVEARRLLEEAADHFRRMVGGDARVYGAEVTNLHRVPERSLSTDQRIECREFVALGAAEHDAFFCGCSGWD